MKPLTHAVPAALALSLLAGCPPKGVVSPSEAPQPSDVRAAKVPRLAVLIVVDQLPVRLLDAVRPQLQGGLARLTGPEAYNGVGRHAHAITFTCPGHATLSTGASPSVNGIVSNDWYAPAAPSAAGEPEGTAVYCGDPALIRVETLSDVVIARGGQVAALSLKDRGAIMIGGRNATASVWFDRAALHFTAPLEALDVQPWFALEWTAIHPEFYATLGPDDAPAEADPGLGLTFPHPAASTAPKTFLFTPYAGDALTDAAIAAVDQLGLGTDDTPDLLGVSYSQTDYIGHAWTSESWEALDGMIRLDASIGRLLNHLDAKVGRDGYVVVLSSDHGSIPAAGATRIPVPAIPDAANKALAAAGFAGNVVWEDPGVWLPASARADDASRAKAARAVAAAIRAVPGIGGAWAWRVDGVDGPYADAVRASLDDERSGDVYVLLGPNALFDYPGSEGHGTSHGTPYDNDALVPVLAWGAPVEPANAPPQVDTRQIAPTIAAWIGMDPPAAAEQPVIQAATR